jgi:hypothetical protein
VRAQKVREIATSRDRQADDLRRPLSPSGYSSHRRPPGQRLKVLLARPKMDRGPSGCVLKDDCSFDPIAERHRELIVSTQQVFKQLTLALAQRTFDGHVVSVRPLQPLRKFVFRRYCEVEAAVTRC